MIELFTCTRCETTTLKTVMGIFSFTENGESKKRDDSIAVLHLCLSCGDIVKNVEQEKNKLASIVENTTGRLVTKVRVGSR